MQTAIQINKQFLIILLTSLGLSFMVLTDQATAQTPVTKIENAAGDSVFTVFEDGGILGPGEFGTGVIPIEGQGTRMMWYPGMAAFRAGGVDSNQWDAANIGEHSVAFGEDTEASGERSTAMGRETIAEASNSTAMGEGTIATGLNSTAMGDGTTASGSNSTALGNSSEASASNATAMGGGGTTASGGQSTAMGNGTTASGFNSTAMSYVTTASGRNSVAMGYVTEASGDASTTMGYATVATTENSLSIGTYNDANRDDVDDNPETGPLFVVGNGSLYTQSDALVLDQSGNMTIAGALTQNSDRRLKKNISPLADGLLDKLSTITPSQFEFKNQQTHPSGQQIGLIAQEVQKQFPELVSEAGNGYLSVSYSKFTTVLLKGMQEQQQKIKSQQTTIDQLKKKTQRIAALEKQVSDIKQSRQMAGMPVSTIGILLLGIAIGGGFWWRSSMEKSLQN